MIAPSSLSQRYDPQTLATLPMTPDEQQRKDRMRDAWKAYRGELQAPLKVQKDQPDDNVRVNRCEPIVNKGVSFLFGQVLKIEATQEAQNIEAGQGATPIQDFVDSVWGNDDDKMTLLSQMAINGAVCGQVFVKLIPPTASSKYPRIVVLDPQLLRIVTDPEDCTLILAYIIEYPGVTDYQKRQIIARVDPQNDLSTLGDDDIEDTWTITNYVRKGMAGTWIQSGEPTPWPYPFAPIFSAQNLPNPNEPWGQPDLSPDLIGINKVLNFILSNISRIIKYHGHPVTYATGLNATQISIAVDDLLCLPSPDSKLEKLAAMDNFSGLLSVVADLRSDMDEQSRIPAVALGRLAELPKGNISGVALQLLFQPIIEKTVQKQRLYGSLIRDICRAALVICGLIGVEDYEDYPIELHWANLLPIDDLAAAQTALLLQQLGVSKDTILQELGYNYDVETDKVAAEAQQQQVMIARGQGMPPPMQTPGAPQQQPQPGQQQESPFMGGGQ